LEIADLSGRSLQKIRGPFNDRYVLAKGILPAGSYFYKFSSSNGVNGAQGKFLILP
jgi:hypothetical protein